MLPFRRKARTEAAVPSAPTNPELPGVPGHMHVFQNPNPETSLTVRQWFGRNGRRVEHQSGEFYARVMNADGVVECYLRAADLDWAALGNVPIWSPMTPELSERLREWGNPCEPETEAER